ncbi:MAG: transcription elongation factor GreA [Chloroflexota bacterium]|nr:transcription elongation factor GreA [Chloroflexota bacterium]
MDAKVKRIPVTREGLTQAKDELRDLKEVRRPRIIEAVADARSHGDLRENAAYDAARHDQAMMEKRIGDLEALINNAQIIDDMPNTNPDVVSLGNTVVIDFDGEEERYKIVGAIEAKPTANRISNESPLGKALLGRRVGQDTLFTTPAGLRTIKIKGIER